LDKLIPGPDTLPKSYIDKIELVIKPVNPPDGKGGKGVNPYFSEQNGFSTPKYEKNNLDCRP